MNYLFKGIVMSLGVFLGVFAPGADAELAARLFRDADSLYVQAEVRNGVSKELRTLVEAGEPVRVALRIRLRTGGDASAKELRHGLRRDVMAGTYLIERPEEGRVLETSSIDAAFILFFAFDRVLVETRGRFEPGREMTISCEAVLELPDRSQGDPQALWNYRVPRREARFSSFETVPR